MITKPPNSGPSHGRFRGTQKNLFSKFGKSDIFPLGPGEIAANTGQRQALIYGNRVARASLAAQAQQVRAAYQMARRGAVESGRAGLSDVAGAMAERGIIGSTVQQVGNEQVKASTQAEIQSAQFEKTTGLLSTNISKLEADAQLRMGLAQLAAQRRARQREMALAAFGSGGQNPWGY